MNTFKEPYTRHLFLTSAFFVFFTGSANLLLFPFIKFSLHWNEAQIGWILGCVSLGSILTNVLISKIIAYLKSHLVVMRLGVTLAGIALLIFGMGLDWYPVLLLNSFVFGSALSLFHMGFYFFIVEHAEKEHLGKWLGTLDTVDRTFGFVGVLTCSHLMDAFGGFYLFGSFSGVLLTSVFFWNLYLREPKKDSFLVNAISH